MSRDYARLESEDGRLHLLSDTMVGRSAECLVRIADPRVSATHARIRTVGPDQWVLRDLGSKNGTRLDNAPVGAGEDILLNHGATLRFGGAANSWVFRSGQPSEVVVQALGEGSSIEADHVPTDGLIVLPSAAEPRALVFRRSNNWVLELYGSETRTLTESLAFEVDGRTYQARVGHDGPTVTNNEDRPSVAAADLLLQVSRDEEHVGVEIVIAGRTLVLPPRNHLYLLVVLGRARAADRARGMGIDEEGWCYVDAVQRELALKSPEALNVYVFRLRQDFGRLGFSDAGQVIERRRASGQLRIGLPCERIRIERTT